MLHFFSMIFSHWVLMLGSVGGFLVVAAVIALTGPATLLKHWKAVVIGLVMLVMAIVIVLLYVELQKVKAADAIDKANYTIVTGQVKTLDADNKNLVAQLSAQSQSIKDAAQAEFAAMAESKAALFAAQAKQATDASQIASLKARIANPQTNQGSCDDEIAYLRAEL